MRNTMRTATLAVLPLVLAGAANPALRAQDQPTVVEGRVEVIEVGVLADVPAGWRGRTAADLAQRVRVVEGGIERTPVSVAELGGGERDPFGRVLIVFDAERCSPEIVSNAALALGSAAERLTALGPVEVARLGESLEPLAAPTRSPGELAATLARIAGDPACGPAPTVERLAELRVDPAALECAAHPCLLAWVGPGSGRPAVAEGEAPAPPPELERYEPLARGLASGGWTFLALPVAKAAGAPRPSGPEPRHDARTGTYTFGIDLLSRDRKKPLSEAEYSSYLDVWQAPLRRLVAATAGELAATADRVDAALEALAGRSLLYYRTERPTDAPSGPLRLEVRAPGSDGRSFRVPEWAPTATGEPTGER